MDKEKTIQEISIQIEKWTKTCGNVNLFITKYKELYLYCIKNFLSANNVRELMAFILHLVGLWERVKLGEEFTSEVTNCLICSDKIMRELDTVLNYFDFEITTMEKQFIIVHLENVISSR